MPKKQSMSSRTGLEAEAINRLTDGVQSPVMRAILVRCLAGDVAPSAAISRMLAEGPSSMVRAAIDNLAHDRVDELTQVFVEDVATLADVGDAAKSQPGSDASRKARASSSLGAEDRDEPRTSE